MWVTILFYATFSIQLILKVLVGNLQDDLGEELGSWVFVISTLTKQISVAQIVISTHTNRTI